MNIKTSQLENGLSIVSIQHQSLSTTVLSLIKTGSRNEEQDINGISHFLEHMCFKGTKNIDGRSMMRMLDGLGAETNAFTSQDYTGYYVKSPKKFWKKTLTTVSDIYHNPTFPEVEMEKEKGVILGEISMYEDMPMRHIYDLFNSLVFADEPLGWSVLGPRKVIKKMKQSDFVEYHNKRYVPNNTVMVVAGDVSHKDVVQEIKKTFETSKNKKIAKTQKVKLNQKKSAIKLHYRKTDQTHVMLGYPTVGFHHKDALAIRMASAVLGSGMSSRLFEKLREDMGVGYYVRSNYSAHEDVGVFQVSCGIDSTRVEETLEAIAQEVTRLQEESVSEEELRRVQEFIIGNTHMNLESSDDLAYFYGKRMLFDLELDSPKNIAKKIRGITARDIKRVVKKYFVKEKLNISMIGPHTSKKEKTFLQSYIKNLR
ncbi:hypothetical protein CL684_02000 [Candidatus Campbellbacteria bacterium]|nr:hypothetical protein [Candidatus Campbellbacteria bacterium]|tara:strand:- start:3729 stop:5006 length:1278 start_codon:yes stop_codon:yes gene_type:complete